MKKIVSTSLLSLMVASSFANEIPGGFKLNGFLSVGSAWSNVDYLTSGILPVYISTIRNRPSFDFDTNVGVQISKPLSEDLSITTQFLAEGYKEFKVEAIWAFLKWEPDDHWQFRAGRVRTSPYMLSDYIEVAYAYPWVRPPQEVYSQVPTVFTNLTGIDGQYKFVFCHRDLTLSAFYGATTTTIDIPVFTASTVYDKMRLLARDLYAFNIKFGDEIFSLRAGYETVRLTADPSTGTLMTGLNNFLDTLVGMNILTPDYINYFSIYNSRASFMGMGYQFDWKNIVSMGELVKRKSDTPVISNAIGWYLMGGYRVEQLLPHITFARERLQGNYTRRFNGVVNALFMGPPVNSPMTLDEVAQGLVGTSTSHRAGAGSQTSVTLGIRWDVVENVALKAEYQHVHPDNGSPGLFDYHPLKSVNIYSLAVNAVM